MRALEPGYAITVADLEATAAAAKVEVTRGDILLVRTGDMSRYLDKKDWRHFDLDDFPGVSVHAAPWLHAREIAAIASDNYAVEVRPSEIAGFRNPFHVLAIPNMGLTLGEIFYLEELAADCAADGRYAFLLVAPPLPVTRGVGTPINPMPSSEVVAGRAGRPRRGRNYWRGIARTSGNDRQAMRILVVDDSSPHRRMLTALFGRAGHEVLTAGDGTLALEILEREPIDAVVSDVKMPKMDGFQLCRAIRQDPRWRRLPFIFYSSIFIGDASHDFGRDLGATAYLDAKEIAPKQVAKELEVLVAHHVRAEYDETLGQLLGDVEFARRYHQVVLDSLAHGEAEDLRELVAASAKALDDVVARLDAERQTMAEAQRTVQSAELALLKELGEYLGDRINNPLAVILASAQLLQMKERSTATSAAAERIGEAVSRINGVVREIALRSGEIPRV